VGPRADAVEKRKIFSGNWTPAVQPVARRYTDLAVPTCYFEAYETRKYSVCILMSTQVVDIVITVLQRVCGVLVGHPGLGISPSQGSLDLNNSKSERIGQTCLFLTRFESVFTLFW
jgi:hypothetical protein